MKLILCKAFILIIGVQNLYNDGETVRNSLLAMELFSNSYFSNISGLEL